MHSFATTDNLEVMHCFCFIQLTQLPIHHSHHLASHTVPPSQVVPPRFHISTRFQIVPGFIAFSQNVPADIVGFVWQERLPNPLYPEPNQQDPPFLAAFYAEHDMSGPDRAQPSHVSYRLLDEDAAGSNSESRIIRGMLADLSRQIQAAVLGADNFNARYGVMVTWYKITFRGNNCQYSGSSDNCAVSYVNFSSL